MDRLSPPQYRRAAHRIARPIPGFQSVKSSGFVALRFRSIRFRKNIREFRRVEHLAAELALNKLDVFLAGDDANIRVFTSGRHIGEEMDLVSSLPMLNPVVNQEFAQISMNFHLGLSSQFLPRHGFRAKSLWFPPRASPKTQFTPQNPLATYPPPAVH